MPSMKSDLQTSADSPSALKAFFLASRPKTWIAGSSPVFIGAALVARVQWEIFLLTLLFSLLIQIGTNYANDYFDFINGADSKLRNGPKRATQEGWIAPQTMLLATFTAFGCALLFAIPLMRIAGLWSLPLAGACVAFGIFYTGGPKLGYLGLGELLVLLFFGPIATCGTVFLQIGTFDFPVFLASLAPGLLSCSILIANNLRDENGDRAAGKRTLVVRFGRSFGAAEYAASLILAALIPLILVAFFGAPLRLALASLIALPAIPLIKKAFSSTELISLLPKSALLLLLYTALFCITLFTGNPL
ncbi:MAG TPA: 1,4-dihydroxy-2-naphthoate octaprenyltransferase [Chlamydiales bacterium]|nr:1,4-dihydroxy-2-naphthoate octaprenyltransferase [Chlamydiales bacterium]